MNKKLSDWASVAEILSGLAVVTTLVILIIGIGENTEVTRASMYASSIESINEMERTVMADPDLRRIYSALLNHQTDDLPQEESITITLMFAQQFRNYDTAYSMREYGLFGENEWSRFDRLICLNYARAVDAGEDSTVHELTSDMFSEYIAASCEE